METQWSDALQEKLALLQPAQRRAIVTIVTGELDGIPLSRLLKTVYSCRYCGKVIGRSTHKGEDRKRLRILHEAEHLKAESGFDKPPLWQFATSYTTYYRSWRKSPIFVQCLEAARVETALNALKTASRLLQLAAPESASELRRQVAEGERDIDRRMSAIAILDRADFGTASKSGTDEGLMQLLLDLRSVEDDEGVLALDGDGED